MNIDKERKCVCTFTQKMVGDGCRYCNPQEYIDRLLDDIAALDEQKAGPSDAEVLSLAYDVGAMPEQMTDAGLKRFARALLSKYAAPAPKGEPVGEQPYPDVPAPDVIHPGEQADSYSLDALKSAMQRAHDRGYSVGWDHGRAAPVNEQDAKDAQALIEAAKQVLNWTEVAHKPPVREAFPCGATARVRVHALADLHDAVAAIAQQGKGEANG